MSTDINNEKLISRYLLGELPEEQQVEIEDRAFSDKDYLAGITTVENDLIELLDSGHLCGASLDVFREEPLPADHPLWRHPGVRVTPHVAAVTLIPEAADQIVAKIHDFESGRSVSGVVVRRRGY